VESNESEEVLEKESDLRKGGEDPMASEEAKELLAKKKAEEALATEERRRKIEDIAEEEGRIVN
jgi:hypothetical protein